MGYPVCMVRKSGSNRVELLDAKGFYLKQLLFIKPVDSCSVNGSTVAVSLADGRIEIYDARNGSYMRTT